MPVVVRLANADFITMGSDARLADVSHRVSESMRAGGLIDFPDADVKHDWVNPAAIIEILEIQEPPSP
jgi:hypothetical protein